MKRQWFHVSPSQTAPSPLRQGQGPLKSPCPSVSGSALPLTPPTPRGRTGSSWLRSSTSTGTSSITAFDPMKLSWENLCLFRLLHSYNRRGALHAGRHRHPISPSALGSATHSRFHYRLKHTRARTEETATANSNAIGITAEKMWRFYRKQRGLGPLRVQPLAEEEEKKRIYVRAAFFS